MRTSLLYILLTALLISGCGSGAASVEIPTPIAIFTAAPTREPATATPIVQATATTEPAATPTSTATDAPTVEPSATPTTTATPITTPTAAATVTPTLAATLTPTVAATSTPTVAVTPTERATATPTPTPTAEPAASGGADGLYAGMPVDLLALMADADPANGQALTVSNGCTACHSLEKDVLMVGPSWYDVGTVAGERVAGESAGLYLYTSIVEPNAFVNEGYLSGLMPLTFGTIFSDVQMADIIAYLLTLQGE